MKFLHKLTPTKGLKITVALFCLMGIAVYTISGAVSTPSGDVLSAEDAELTLPPELTINDADFEGEAPFRVTFDSKQFVDSVESCSWNFGDGETSQGQVTSHTFLLAGTYSVTLTAKEKSGELLQKEILVLVQPKE